MENEQRRAGLIKPTQEQIKPLFILWSHELAGTEDFKMRVEMTRAYLVGLDCEEIWALKIPTAARISRGFVGNEDEEIDLGTLILENGLSQLLYTIHSEDSAESKEQIKRLHAYFTQVKRAFELLKEKGFNPIESLSQAGRNRLEAQVIEHHLPLFGREKFKADVKHEEQLVYFIEAAGLFRDFSEKKALDFAEQVVRSKSTHLLKWMFSRGLSPDTRIEKGARYAQQPKADKWPLASLSPTMDVLNVFVSHGANLALTSENGVSFSELLSKRTGSSYAFDTPKDRDQIIRAVYKAEANTQANPQEQMWGLIEKAVLASDAAAAIRSHEGACDLRDAKGRHVVQFAMTQKPYLVNAILSVNKKALALGSTPDKQGRTPAVYWIASGLAQTIQETSQTAVVIPKQVDETAWRQAAALAYELELGALGLCSMEVQRRFKRTTGQALDEWVEKEAANGNPWFEHAVDMAVKRAKAKKKLTSIQFMSSLAKDGERGAMEVWSDPENHRVVNEGHALFRAHVMLANWVLENQYKYPFSRYHSQNPDKDQEKVTHAVEDFLKKHLIGKPFDKLKDQLNEKASFVDERLLEILTKSQWWKETCTTMERDGLLKEHAKVIKISAQNAFDAL